MPAQPNWALSLTTAGTGNGKSALECGIAMMAVITCNTDRTKTALYPSTLYQKKARRIFINLKIAEPSCHDNAIEHTFVSTKAKIGVIKFH